MASPSRSKKAPSKAVATKAEAALPAALMQQTETGFEDTGAQDYAIPYLSIAQGQSKALKKDSSNHVPGLQLGEIYDAVAGKRWEEEVRLIPVHRERSHVEWNDRTFVGRHDPSENLFAGTTRNEKNFDVLPNGHHLVDTVYLYALVEYDSGVWGPVVITFARASDKVYKKLMSRAQRLKLPNGAQAPLFSHIYTFGTNLETSKNGDDYYNWTIAGEPEIISEDALFEQVVTLRGAVVSGQKGAAEPAADDDVI
jgi:hypothetical protein